MDKLRFPLALFLSFVILFAWSAMQERPPVPSEDGGAATESTDGGEVAAPTVPELPEPTSEVGEAAEPWEEWIELGRAGEPGHYWARFSNRGASLVELRLDGYYVEGHLDAQAKTQRENWVPLLTSVETPDGPTRSFLLRSRASSAYLERTPFEEALWEHEVLKDESGRANGVRFTLRPGTGVALTKTFRVVEDKYELALELGVANEGLERALPSTFILTPASVVPQASTDKFYIEPQAVVATRGGGDSELDLISVKRDDRGKETQGSLGGGGKISFAGVHNKYFAVLLRGADELASATIGQAEYRRLKDETFASENPAEADRAWHFLATDIDLTLRVPSAGQPPSNYEYRIYAGPKDREIIAEDHPDHERLTTADLGFFATIARILLGILGLFHGLTGNWGWSIILLTLSVRLALFPMNRRSQTAMARHQTKMKRVQPKLDEIKEKYAKNPQKQRQEQARIMQEEGVMPPLGGCLPIFLQIPVFFGLFQSLRTSFDMRQAHFLGWIDDLSMPDRLARINLDTHLPFIGTIEYLNVLPPLMVVLWVLQQKVMPKPTDEQALRMQKMMVWMPVMFGFFLYNYAAGLSLYMITTSVFGILEQTVIKRIWPLDTTEKPRKKGGFMAKMMELSEQAQKMQEAQRQQKAAQARKGGKGGKGKGR